jgi:hypothetical protein
MQNLSCKAALFRVILWRASQGEDCCGAECSGVDQICLQKTGGPSEPEWIDRKPDSYNIAADNIEVRSCRAGNVQLLRNDVLLLIKVNVN